MTILRVLLLVAVAVYQTNALTKLEDVFTWKELPFAWPSEEAKNAAISEKDYIPENNLPLGLARWKNKLFVTIPRWKAGVAASLGYLSLDEPVGKNAAVIPYPDWKANTIPKDGAKPESDNHIISTFRVTVDECDRLWILDTGIADILGGYNQISPPAIVIYDLKTDTLIKRYNLRHNEDVKDSSFFANIIVDSNKDKCDDAYAYVPDLGSYALVVYSLKDNDSWRFKHNYFHFDPLNGDFNVGGVNFQWTDGVFSLALGPESNDGYRTVYFHALASLNEFSVDSSVLRNKTLASDPHIYNLFKLEGLKGDKSQTSASVFDEKTNSLFLTQLNRNGVACWNPKKPLKPENVALVTQDDEKLIFTNDIKIDAERNLWILSDKMPKFIYGKLNPEEINYRIMKVKIDDAVAGTPCAA
ncbi:L-dopachrome tautomerase yellow-c [Rhynchophorus ferrugineus]|uniref:L-dopachrome tautomerase yellow-c n=1 Tax=Rhynchophorus ferrugineus TaxID=354439 RepID=UPI003FCC7830